MTKRTLTVMAVVLVAATAVTAAAAFAGAPKDCHSNRTAERDLQCNVSQQVAQQVSQSSEAILLLKTRNLHGKRTIVVGIRLPR